MHPDPLASLEHNPGPCVLREGEAPSQPLQFPSLHSTSLHFAVPAWGLGWGGASPSRDTPPPGPSEMLSGLTPSTNSPRATGSDIQVLDLERVLLDELTAGLDIVAPEGGKQVVGGGRIPQPGPEPGAPRRGPGGLPQGLGVPLPPTL